MTWESKHRTFFEVAKNKNQPPFHILRTHVWTKARGNLSWTVLSYINLFAIKLIGLGIFLDLSNTANSYVKSSDGRSFIRIKRFNAGRCRSCHFCLFRLRCQATFHSSLCSFRQFLGRGIDQELYRRTSSIAQICCQG